MGMLFAEECYAIRGAVYEVYATLGIGFAEEVYQEALEAELGDRKIPYSAQQTLRIRYKERWLEKTYVPDLICFGKIIVELKAAKALLPEHEAQVINYLKATGLELGLLVNFGAYPAVEIRTCTRRKDYRGGKKHENTRIGGGEGNIENIDNPAGH